MSPEDDHVIKVTIHETRTYEVLVATPPGKLTEEKVEAAVDTAYDAVKQGMLDAHDEISHWSLDKTSEVRAAFDADTHKMLWPPSVRTRKM